MLKGFIKHRPKRVLALYVELEHIQVVRARRRWRQWEIEATEHLAVPEGETLHEFLNRLEFQGRQGTALILFLPRTYYSFHREHYPLALEDRLEEALTFDWQENLFHEQTLHFSGSPVPIDHHLSVPIFSLQKDVHERFHQALEASAFDSFTVIPSALSYSSFFPSLAAQEETLPIEIMGRFLDPSHLEVHRFYHGHLLDSMVLGKSRDNLRLFRESLLCVSEGQCQSEAHIHLLCAEGECSQDCAKAWESEDLSLRVHTLEGSILSHWLKYLLDQEEIQSFDDPLLLKPWKAPRIVWPLLFAAALYALFAFFQVDSFNRQKETSRELKATLQKLEAEWKPTEQLQGRIAKFMEDQKTLSEFNVEGYPLLEILTVLSQSTPPDTWLNYLSVQKGQLSLRGESKSAIKYLPELSKLDGFTEVRFSTPVTRTPASDRELFNLLIKLDLLKFNKTIEGIPPLQESSEPSVKGEAPSPPPESKPREAPADKKDNPAKARAGEES